MNGKQLEQLYSGIINIDDKYIEEAESARFSIRKTAWMRHIAAACVCIVAAAVAVFAHLTPWEPEPRSGDNRVVSILRNENQSDAIYHLSGADTAPAAEVRVIFADGTSEKKEYIITEDTEKPDRQKAWAEAEARHRAEVEAAKEYAYRDVDNATPEEREKILAARKAVIYSESWAADGCVVYIDRNDGTSEKLPEFSTLFPGWDMPVDDKYELTEDGLGAHCLYGLSVQILRINDTSIICRSNDGEIKMNGIENQEITVVLPDGNTADTLGIKAGDDIFVSYFGKDCSIAACTIYANEIMLKAPFDK